MANADTIPAPRKCKALNRGRFGWALQWEDGATSYMPNQETAIACAASPDLVAACRELIDVIPSPLADWYTGRMLAALQGVVRAYNKAGSSPAEEKE